MIVVVIIIIIMIIISFMELGHLLTRSDFTYLEVSSKVYHDSFCQHGSSISLPWVTYFEAFYLHVVSSFSCIPVICPKLLLFSNPLQLVHLFCNLSQVYPAVLLMYFISTAVILLASLAVTVHVSLPYNKTGRASVLYSFILVWVIHFEAFYLHVVSSISCIPVICPKLLLFSNPLQLVHLFLTCPKFILLFFSCISSLLLLFFWRHLL